MNEEECVEQNVYQFIGDDATEYFCDLENQIQEKLKKIKQINSYSNGRCEVQRENLKKLYDKIDALHKHLTPEERMKFDDEKSYITQLDRIFISIISLHKVMRDNSLSTKNEYKNTAKIFDKINSWHNESMDYILSQISTNDELSKEEILANYPQLKQKSENLEKELQRLRDSRLKDCEIIDQLYKESISKLLKCDEEYSKYHSKAMLQEFEKNKQIVLNQYQVCKDVCDGYTDFYKDLLVDYTINNGTKKDVKNKSLEYLKKCKASIEELKNCINLVLESQNELEIDLQDYEICDTNPTRRPRKIIVPTNENGKTILEYAKDEVNKLNALLTKINRQYKELIKINDNNLHCLPNECELSL